MIKQLITYVFCVTAIFCAKAQVGIGTSTPSAALDLEVDTLNVEIGINNINAADVDPLIQFQVSGDTLFNIGVNDSVSDVFKIGTYKIDSNTALIIDDNGDVGFGIENPIYKGDVYGDANISTGGNIYRGGLEHLLSTPNTNNLYMAEGAGAQNNAAGTDNTYLGFHSGYSSTSGDYNIALGRAANYSNTSGDGNIALGYSAGYSSSTSDNSIKLGYQAGSNATGANLLYIDNSNATNPLLYVSNFTDSNDLYSNGGLIINEQSGDFDFRVESDNRTHMLFVQAQFDYLHIRSDINVTGRLVQVNSATNSAGMAAAIHSAGAISANVSFVKGRGTEASPVVVSNGDILGSLQFGGNDGSDFNTVGGAISAVVSGTPGVGDMPTELRFLTAADGSSFGTTRMVIDEDGFLGINNNDPSTRLFVTESANTTATFNRLTDDGVLLDFEYNGVSEGNISVSGSAISYNPFTGAHYGKHDSVLSSGLIVSLNGNNSRFNDKSTSEIIYGVQPSTVPNDKLVLGAYAGLLSENDTISNSNPALILAVGNGVLWATSEGGDLAVGDYLISSSTAGMAMKDNGDFAVSYIIARVTEAVKWSKVKADVGGLKKKLVHVTYEHFEVENNIAEAIKAIEKELELIRLKMTQKTSI